MRCIVDRYGLGTRNESGENLVEFCIGNNLVITNSLFLYHPRHRYTWIFPGRQYKNQIDYILLLVQARWISSINNLKTLPGLDCGSDHNLLLAKIRIRKTRKVERKSRLNPDIMDKFRHNLERTLETISDNVNTQILQCARPQISDAGRHISSVKRKR